MYKREVSISLDKITWEKQKINLIKDLVTGRFWKLTASISKEEIAIQYSECAFRDCKYLTLSCWLSTSSRYGTSLFAGVQCSLKSFLKHSAPPQEVTTHKGNMQKRWKIPKHSNIERFNKFIFFFSLKIYLRARERASEHVWDGGREDQRGRERQTDPARSTEAPGSMRTEDQDLNRNQEPDS